MTRARTLWLATLLLLGLAARVWRATPDATTWPSPSRCRLEIQVGPTTSPISCLDPAAPRAGFARRWPPRCRNIPAPEHLQPGDRVVARSGRCRVLRMAAGQIRTLGLPVAINRADAAEIRVLPGVGWTLARRIVESRRLQGPFRGPRDLYRVKGVGPRQLARLRNRLVF